MFFNKKSQSYSTLGKIILILLVAIFILLVVDPLLKGGERGSDIAACKNWAVLQSAIKEPVTGSRLKEFKNPCVTFQDKLKGDEFEQYDIIARGMYDTWNMYGQGKVDFFSDWDWGTKNTNCLIGDEIKIDKDRKWNIDTFEEFLSDNYPPNSEITYAEYLTGTKNTKLDFGSGSINLEKDEKIYIIFTVEKKINGDYGIIVSSLPGCFAGAKVGAIIGGTVSIGTLALPASALGCGIGGIISFGGYVIGHSNELYPGLFIVTQKDLSSLKKECDGGLHYKPA